AGWYDVMLTVQSGMCFDDTTISIYVQVPEVSIHIPLDSICHFPVDVPLSATANATIASYVWIMPSGETSTEATPTDSYIYSETEYSINEATRPGAIVEII